MAKKPSNKELSGIGVTIINPTNKRRKNTNSICVISKDVANAPFPERVNHPAHYGGEHNPYEAIKVIEAWDMNFNLGNTLKYISRAGKKGSAIEDLKKAAFYLNREIQNLEKL